MEQSTGNLNNGPLLSIIVTAYNHEHLVGRTLDHILAQKVDFKYEVIIGEDASPMDNTRAVCQRYADNHPNIIKLMPAAPNKGVLKNYRDCIKECQGKYLTACAGDDWWHNHDKLQIQVSFLESNPDYGMVHTLCDFCEEVNGKIRPATLRNPPQGEVYRALFKYCFVSAPTALYCRDLLDFVDFEALRNTGIEIEDYPTWLEISRHTKIGFLNVSTVTYSIIENSISHSATLEKRLKFIDQIFLIHKFYIERYPEDSLSEAEANIFYKRSIYMELLKFKKYHRAQEMVNELGFSSLIGFVLRMPLVGRFVWCVLNSSLYQRIKKL